MQLSVPGTNAGIPVLVSTGTSGGYILWHDAMAGVIYYAEYFADGSIGEFHAANTNLSKYTAKDMLLSKMIFLSVLMRSN